MKKIKNIIIYIIVVLMIAGCVEKKLENISLKVDNILAINETSTVKVEYTPRNIREDISWESSDEKIATVNNGIVTGKSIGVVTITATTSSGIKNQVSIEVYQNVESLTFDKDNVELFVGDKTQIKATITPTEAKYKDIIWTSTNNDVAIIENGLITAIGPGEATITATTKEGISQNCKVLVKEKPIEFSGSGDKIITNITIPNGVYKVIMKNSGRSNFIVKFYENDSSTYGDLLANEIGAYNGEVIFRDGATASTSNGMLEVKSSGKWSIKFEAVSGTILSKSVNGKGDVVTGWFHGDGKRQVATFNNSGKSNFIVWLCDEYGSRDLLVNEIGAYTGQTTFITNSSTKYYFEVSSSGNWTIKWE